MAEKIEKASTYKSPVGKLVKYFEKSRDKWKSKYKDVKYRAKLLTNQVRYLKGKNAELKKTIKLMESGLGGSGENNTTANHAIVEKFGDVARYHTYCIGQMYLFVQLVLFASVSMRAASRILSQIFSFLEIQMAAASWYTGRLWLLRVGLYKLERAKPMADDWIWIIDHTVQLGKEKCLVILGVRQQSLPNQELHLTHELVEPIALYPVERSNGQIVFEQLEKAVSKTGVPKQIVSDHGTDLKSGIKKFCENHDTVHTYDMKHKGAAILKRELNQDPDWQNFVKLASKTGKKLQQTDLSALTPPNQRSKARYMNVDKLVEWGNRTLLYLDHQKADDVQNFEHSAICQKLGWLKEFEQNLKKWENLVAMVSTANQYININGLEKGAEAGLKMKLAQIQAAESLSAITEELVSFVKTQAQDLKDGDRLVGSSEIIESVIGKYKSLQHDQVKGGFTGMLLGLAASVSDFSKETVEKAIAEVSTKRLLNWIKDNVGTSVFARRKEIKKIVKQQEQKWDEKSDHCRA